VAEWERDGRGEKKREGAETNTTEEERERVDFSSAKLKNNVKNPKNCGRKAHTEGGGEKEGIKQP